MQCQDSDLLAYLMALGGSKLVQARLVLELLPFFTIFTKENVNLEGIVIITSTRLPSYPCREMARWVRAAVVW